ncbi:TraR/DksA family transcriptional regulator [Brachybacterium sp. AOP43-C2-M15]|uniref:TraR/DksA family transcriptional regulator n=1 Tax=Brachybacterium sp. AOP43-C2-M15 TaxID=3457661 RepID=UPI004034B912
MDDQENPAAGPRSARLEARRSEVLAQLTEIEHELTALRSTREGLSDDDEHDPDGVPLSSQWDRLEGLKQAKRDQLASIDEALSRTERGQEERCRVCGRPIAPARLEVRPEATTCIDCAP